MDNEDSYDSSSGNEAGGPASAVFDEMGDFAKSMLWFYFPGMIADRVLPYLHSFWYSGARRNDGPPPKGSQLWLKHRAWTCTFIILCTLVYSMHNTIESRARNHYEVIGVAPSTLVEQTHALPMHGGDTGNGAASSNSEGLALLRSRFRQLSLQLHPDKNPSPDAPAMFVKVQTARAVLENSATRNIHDLLGPTMAVYCSNDGNEGGHGRRGRSRSGRAGSTGVKLECEDYGKVVKMYIAHGLMPVYLIYGGLITLMMLFQGASRGTYWRIIGFFFYIYIDLTTATGQLAPTVTAFLHDRLWWTPYDLSMFVHRTSFLVFAAINQIGSALASTSPSKSAEDQLTMVAAAMTGLTNMSAQIMRSLQMTLNTLHQPLQGRPTAAGSAGRRDLRDVVEGKMVDEMKARLLCQDEAFAAVYQEALNQAVVKMVR